MAPTRALPTIAIAFLAACARGTPPRTAPAPSVPTSGTNSPRGNVVLQGSGVPATNETPLRASTEVARPTESASDAAPIAAPADALAVANAPSWDIEVRSYESTERVDHYVKLFSGPARERVETWLARGTRYESMIRAKLREGGLPEDMYYLALVESGFDPNAYSRAAAVGMWQFMTSTARDIGMRVDWWVDERRDPMKSTDGAVRFLKELNEQFGSLYLAAAAYNGGPGRIARGLTRYADDFEGTAGDDLFFALAEKDYLRNETREYVPQLIAAALIAKEPARYGMNIVSRPVLEYDSVRVAPLTPLAAVAHATRASLASMQDLNPHLLRGVTPPKDSFFVRVPVGSSADFSAAFDALPENEKTAFTKRESRKGESVESIARREGISARQLASYNPNLKTLKSGNLAAGQMLLVPTVLVASAATSVPDPSIERFSTASGSTKMHIVKSGETLRGIAKRYHTTTEVLMTANKLRRPIVVAGQSLVVGGTKTLESKAPAKMIAASSAKHGASAKADVDESSEKPLARTRVAKGQSSSDMRESATKQASLSITSESSPTRAQSTKDASGSTKSHAAKPSNHASDAKSATSATSKAAPKSGAASKPSKSPSKSKSSATSKSKSKSASKKHKKSAE